MNPFNPYKVDKNVAIDRFKCALLNVAPVYFSSTNPDSSTSFRERVFSYELYHQLRLNFSGAWYVNGEFRKGLSMIPATGRHDAIIPDIAIHQSGTIDHNLLVAEIKTTQNLGGDALLHDIEKLEFLTRPAHLVPSGLDLKIGIMLRVNSDFEKIFSKMTKELKSKAANELKKAPRVAIWNIQEPLPCDKSSSGALRSECLKIYRADWPGYSEN